jgi:hypothetical protein
VLSKEYLFGIFVNRATYRWAVPVAAAHRASAGGSDGTSVL